MTLTKEEKETIINFNEAEEEAYVYTCSPNLWKALEKMGLKAIREERDSKGRLDGKEFVVPKYWIKIQPMKKKGFSWRGKIR